MHLTSSSNRLLGYVPGILLAHPALAAATAGNTVGQSSGLWSIPQFIWNCCEELGWQRIGIPLLLAAALSLILLWPFARIIAGRTSILVRTTLFTGNMIVLSAAFLALGYFVTQSESITLVAVFAIVCAAVLLSQTRHQFEASRAAAAGIVGCFLVTFGVGLCATEFLMGPTPWMEFLSKSSEDRGRVFAAWLAKENAPTSVVAAVAPSAAESSAATTLENPSATPVSPATTTPSVAPAAPLPPMRTGPDLQALYAQLQKSRAELDMKDAAAVARFNGQVAAYQQEKALAAAMAVPRAVPAKPAAR